MKERELRQHLICSLCGRKIGESGLPLFSIVTIVRMGIDMKAVERATGLQTFLGSPVLGMVMGPDEDMAKEMSRSELTVCENCNVIATMSIAALAERGMK
jgi:hypothetical protein